MRDTRETIYLDAKYGPFGHCRFEQFDIVLFANDPDKIIVLTCDPEWNVELRGWCLLIGNILLHESNFIKANEFLDWKPYENGLWSWWVRKNNILMPDDLRRVGLL